MVLLYGVWVVFMSGFMVARHTIEPEYPYGTRLAVRHCIVDKVEVDKLDRKTAAHVCAEQNGMVLK